LLFIIPLIDTSSSIICRFIINVRWSFLQSLFKRRVIFYAWLVLSCHSNRLNLRDLIR
jgi:hypothetical protein